MSRRFVAALVVSSVVAAGCVGGASGTDATDQVELFGPFQDGEAELLARSLEPFEERTGIDIRYTGTGSFAADLQAQIRGADPPDIAFVPQPGLVAELARDGVVLPVGTRTAAAVDSNYEPETRAFAEVDGVLIGVPFRISLKSLVWYSPPVFDELGLEVPDTLAELGDMTAELEERGVTPWCFGLEAQGATGWVATDWVEELVLRRQGPDLYDRWADGEVPFADERIADAFDEVRAELLAPGRSAGGLAGIIQTPVRDAPLGLLRDPPECVLHRQASFAFGWLRGDVEFGPDGDIDVFVLPGLDGGPAPLLVGTVLAVAFDDRPDVDAVMAHLAGPASTRAWEEAGGFVSPRSTGGVSPLATPVDRAVVEILRDADVVRIDASDLMTPEVGTGLLWSEIAAWVAEATTYDRLAAVIDEARAAE